jgi:hypothetical protein
MRTTRAAAFAALICCLGLSSCGFEDMVAVGPEQHTPISLDGAGVEKANIELDMGAGQLIVHGGADKMLSGTFTYNVDSWKPIVTTNKNDSHATVTIKQPEGGHGGGKTKYIWDLNLNDQILTDLAINCGAGQAQLNLGDLALRGLSVRMGAGQVQLDLSGTEPKHDYDVTINGGVGQADIRLPKGVGVWAQAQGGIGSVTVTGLEKHGDHWENDLYDKSKVTVKLTVHGGIGEIKIAG